MMTRSSGLVTVIIMDPEGHRLGSSVLYHVPSPGDTISGHVLPPGDEAEPVEVAGEVTHREWTDGGVVIVTIEPS